MLSSNLGYPRIGESREWKRALESLWKGQLNETEFHSQLQEIRLQNIKKQIDRGIDLIPVNDFTYYDHVLDMAVMFGLVPRRYEYNKGDISLNLYYAMARGNEKAVASEMTKWFNTNYHYIVPEIEFNQQPVLIENKPLMAYQEAKQEFGIEGKPVILGLFTFLKLAKGYKKDDFEHLVNLFLPLYTQILRELEEAGVTWVQIDEPSLVTSIEDDEMEIIEKIYAELHQAAPSINIMLQTYFDSIEHYTRVMNLSVKGIGLDFTEGIEGNLAAIKKYGFNDGKVLGAGIIDGRNIWRADLNEKKKLVTELLAYVSEERLWIQPSCSLLHVPVTVKSETKLEDKIKQALAFADEKLDELYILSKSFQADTFGINQLFNESTKAIQALNKSAARNHTVVQEEVDSIVSISIQRPASFEERSKLQKEKWNLPILPTTTIGSFPQTAEVRRARSLYKSGEWTKEIYDGFIKNQITDWIGIQEIVNLDVLVHGEFERNDMVEYFGEKLGGFTFMKNGWVQSYGSRCVKPPVIYGDVRFIEPMTVSESIYAQSLTKKPVKGMLTGPVTILNWSFVRDDITRSEVCNQIALALKKEIKALEDAGITMIQVDEPALREGLPLKKEKREHYLDWAVQAFLLTTCSVENTTQIHTHMCYCDFNHFMNVISRLDADVISLETSRSHGELMRSQELAQYDKGVGLGVYDIHSPRIPTVTEMKELIEKTLSVVDQNLVWINPDCGLKTRGIDETVASLKNMVKATQLVRMELVEPIS